MTKLVILSPAERRRFDSPPHFTGDERSVYFSLPSDVVEILDRLRTPTNKVGFMLQLGYFKSQSKFFTYDQFRQPDIQYVAQILGCTIDSVYLEQYQKKIPLDHRKKILSLLKWQSFDVGKQKALAEHIVQYVQHQLTAKKICLQAIDYCWQNKIEVPSYNQLALIITESFNQNETHLVNQVTKFLTNNEDKALFALMTTENGAEEKHFKKPTITLLRHVNQSLQPSDIKENVEVFELVKQHFYQLKNLIEHLPLSDNATEYFATWVKKARTFQLNSFANRHKAYLYLLAYLKHHYYFRQDFLMDIFLKSVLASLNAAKKQLSAKEKATRSERNKAIKKLSRSNKNSRLVIEAITEIVQSPMLSEKQKLTEIESKLTDYHQQQDEQARQQMLLLENDLEKIGEDQELFNALESLSVKLN